MTRVLNGTLSTDLQGDVTTFCRCWEITKTNGDIVRITDHDADVILESNTYTTDGGFTISAVEAGENLAVDNADLSVLLQTNIVNEADLVNGVYDGASIKVWLVNFENTANYCALPGAYLAKMNSADTDNAVFEMVSLSAKLNENTTARMIPMCDADLGDARCGVNLVTYTVSGTVTGVGSVSQFTDSSRAEADDYFNFGKLTWTSGNNNGLEFEVSDFSSGIFKLHGVCPNDIETGDTYDVHRGCDQTPDTCKDVYSNYVNFRGFPFNIDNLEMISGPKA